MNDLVKTIIYNYHQRVLSLDQATAVVMTTMSALDRRYITIEKRERLSARIEALFLSVTDEKTAVLAGDEMSALVANASSGNKSEI